MRVKRRSNHQKRGMSLLSLSGRWPSYHTVLGHSLKGMSVDDFLGAGFMEEDQDVSLNQVAVKTLNVIYALG
jgi:hypothetical protein